ncbi:MAG TPA: DUF3617 family protein [Candidatus Binatia bacterium]|nr:DUF3617 family protein [Candidatus Binatia bacterium]
MRALILSIVLMTAAGASAATFEPPKRKSGLWETKVSNAQVPRGQTMQQCIDQKTDDMMRKEQESHMSCSKKDMRREGDRIVGDSVCKIEGTTVTTHTVITGNFDTNYKAEVKSTYNPPVNGQRESSSTVEGKYLGACLAGQKPGDVVMPQGGQGNQQNMPRGGPPAGR